MNLYSQDSRPYDQSPGRQHQSPLQSTGVLVKVTSRRLLNGAASGVLHTGRGALAAGRWWDRKGPRYLFFFLAAGALVVLVLSIMAALGAQEAVAAPEGPDSTGDGGGDAIQGTLANVRDYIAGILLVLGGIGFVVSLGLKAASPINENAQFLANYGMKSSLIAVLAGAIVNPIMNIVEGLAASGGG